jgi:RimJ/RimL family protein N-acetyltransferase
MPTRSSPQPVLETARLALRPFVPADADAVQAIVSAPAIADATLTIPHPYPPGAAARWIATQASGWEAGTDVVFALTRRDDGAIVGAMGCGITDAHLRAELGYWIAVAQWGQGYATEAGAVVLGFAFGTLGLHRVQARHFLRNPASGRVMQKLGMRFEGITRAGIRKDGRFEDLAVYARLATDDAAQE